MSELKTSLQPVLTSIMSNMQTVESSLGESFFEVVLTRLDSLGYTATADDVWMIIFESMKVENKIKSSCNIILIPTGLFEVSVDMVCGEFLFTKKATGKLTGFDFGAAIKQISEGDTSMTFIDGLSAEQQFEGIISYLKSCGENQFVSYRKMSW